MHSLRFGSRVGQPGESLALLLAILLLQDPVSRPDRGRAQEPPPQSSDTTIVVPPSARNEAGGRNTVIPFSWKPVRYQQLIPRAAFGTDETLLLGGMSFRLGRTPYSNQGTVDLEIALATPPEGRELSPLFVENVGRARQVVVPRQKVEVKASEDRLQEGNDPLEIWDLHFTFARPFKYRPDRSLVFEITVFGNDQGRIFTFPLDAWESDQVLRNFGELDASGGATGSEGLVVRFDVLARAAAPPRDPASRPASRAATPAESRSAGGSR